jgi:hypothetical protein
MACRFALACRHLVRVARSLSQPSPPFPLRGEL